MLTNVFRTALSASFLLVGSCFLPVNALGSPLPSIILDFFENNTATVTPAGLGPIPIPCTSGTCTLLLPGSLVSIASLDILVTDADLTTGDMLRVVNLGLAPTGQSSFAVTLFSDNQELPDGDASDIGLPAPGMNVVTVTEGAGGIATYMPLPNVSVNIHSDIEPVPEPGTLSLVGAAGLALVGVVRRKRAV